MTTSYDPIAYTYDADVWCLDCLPVPQDDEEVGAIFQWSEWWDASSADCDTLACNACHTELDVIHDPQNCDCDVAGEAKRALAEINDLW